MSKRDDVARIICARAMCGCDPIDACHQFSLCIQDAADIADAILAILADPDDRMVEAAMDILCARLGVTITYDDAKAAIRAAMKAAGE